MTSRHRSHVNSNTTLFDSALKYDSKGPIAILELTTVSELSENEFYWMHKLNSIFPYGWNTTDNLQNMSLYVFSEDYAKKVSENSKKNWKKYDDKTRTYILSRLHEGSKKWMRSLSPEERELYRIKNMSRGKEYWKNLPECDKEKRREQLKNDSFSYLKNPDFKEQRSYYSKRNWQNYTPEERFELCKKISEGNKGKRKSKEHCKALSEAHMGKVCKTTKQIYSIELYENYTVITLYDSQRDADRTTGISYKQIWKYLKKGNGKGMIWGYTGRTMPPRL